MWQQEFSYKNGKFIRIKPVNEWNEINFLDSSPRSGGWEVERIVPWLGVLNDLNDVYEQKTNIWPI
jgi:hypothetical protein